MNQAYFVITAIFLSIFGTAYSYLSYRNKERLALIESGLSPDSFSQAVKGKSNFLLISGLVFIGFSLGVFSGFFLERFLLNDHNPLDKGSYPQAYLTMVPLCMGISLLTSFLLIRKRKA